MNMATQCYTIFCIVLKDERQPFPIEIAAEETVSKLKKYIMKELKFLFAHVDAHAVKLFRIDLADDDELVSKARALQLHQLDELEETIKLSGVYPEAPPEETIHILVHLPHSHSNTINIMQQGLIPRAETIKALYAKLNEEHFIMVRGTPASGKSCMARLLQATVAKEEADANIMFIDSWPTVSPPTLYTYKWSRRLRERGWRSSTTNVIIFDDAQNTYWDISLWNEYFKYMDWRSRDRVVLFANRTPPDRLPIPPLTPIIIGGVRRVDLRPINLGYNRDAEPVGLLLTRAEFTQMVDKLCPSHVFDPTFLEFTFELTAGHVGAVADLIPIVTSHGSYLHAKDSTSTYTWANFVEGISVKEIFDALYEGFLFRRGLPAMSRLQDPRVAHVFRTVLASGVIEKSSFTPGYLGALDTCFQRGWLHTDESRETYEIIYFFPTPLHQWFVEYQLSTDSQKPQLTRAIPLNPMVDR